MSDTFSKLLWLKRTNGHKFTQIEFRVLLAIYNHSNELGQRSFPSLETLVEETTHNKSDVSKARTSLKSKGWIHETYRGNGKSGRSSSYELVPDAPNPDYRCGLPKCKGCVYTQPLESSKVGDSDSKVGDFPPMVASTRNKGCVQAQPNRSLTDHRTDHGSDTDSDPFDTGPTSEVKRTTPNGVVNAATLVAAIPDPFNVEEPTVPVDSTSTVPTEPSLDGEGDSSLFTLKQSQTEIEDNRPSFEPPPEFQDSGDPNDPFSKAFKPKERAS